MQFRRFVTRRWECPPEPPRIAPAAAFAFKGAGKPVERGKGKPALGGPPTHYRPLSGHEKLFAGILPRHPAHDHHAGRRHRLGWRQHRARRLLGDRLAHTGRRPANRAEGPGRRMLGFQPRRAGRHALFPPAPALVGGIRPSRPRQQHARYRQTRQPPHDPASCFTGIHSYALSWQAS